jgi:hypothetical protein
LHQLFITCFSTSRSFWLAIVWGVVKRPKTVCTTGWEAWWWSHSANAEVHILKEFTALCRWWWRRRRCVCVCVWGGGGKYFFISSNIYFLFTSYKWEWKLIIHLKTFKTPASWVYTWDNIGVIYRMSLSFLNCCVQSTGFNIFS